MIHFSNDVKNPLLSSEDYKYIKSIDVAADALINVVSLIQSDKPVFYSEDTVIDLTVSLKNSSRKIRIDSQNVKKIIKDPHLISIKVYLKTLLGVCIAKEQFNIQKLNAAIKRKRPLWEISESGQMILKNFKKIDRRECETLITLFERSKAKINLLDRMQEELEILEGSISSYICKRFKQLLFKNREVFERTKVNQWFQELEKKTFHAYSDDHSLELEEDIGEPFQVTSSKYLQKDPLEEMYPQSSILHLDGEECFDLKRLAFIPVEFHWDEVFIKYKCSISGDPIRTVLEETSETGVPILYEKIVVETLLSSEPVSPVSGRPLCINQLISRPDIQSIIDERLDFFSEQIKMKIIKNFED